MTTTRSYLAIAPDGGRWERPARTSSFEWVAFGRDFADGDPSNILRGDFFPDCWVPLGYRSTKEDALEAARTEAYKVHNPREGRERTFSYTQAWRAVVASDTYGYLETTVVRLAEVVRSA